MLNHLVTVLYIHPTYDPHVLFEMSMCKIFLRLVEIHIEKLH